MNTSDMPECEACRQPMKVYEPDQKTHPNCEPRFDQLVNITRRLGEQGLPHCTCEDLEVAGCQHCVEFAKRLEPLR